MDVGLAIILGPYDFHSLCSALVIVMEPTQHRNGDHFVRLGRVKWRAHWGVGNPLPQPLMRSSSVKVHAKCLEKMIQLLLMQDQEVIQAFSSHTQEKAFTDGIRSWSSVRCSKDLDAAGCCHTGKMRAEFAIIVPHQVFGSFSIRSGLAQLLRYPEICRRSRHIHMDPPCAISVQEGRRQKGGGRRDR
jgi:hypothetical protein